MSNQTIVLIVIGGFFLIGFLAALVRKLGIKIPTTVDPWKTYVRGQGVLLLLFLVIGGVSAGVSVYFSPYLKNLNDVGQVKEYHIDPSKQALYQENIQSYSRLILFARAAEPAASSARITLFRNRSGETGDIQRIENVSSSTWTRVDLDNAYSDLGLMVEPPAQAGAVPATQVDVFIYLGIK